MLACFVDAVVIDVVVNDVETVVAVGTDSSRPLHVEQNHYKLQ